MHTQLSCALHSVLRGPPHLLLGAERCWCHRASHGFDHAGQCCLQERRHDWHQNPRLLSNCASSRVDRDECGMRTGGVRRCSCGTTGTFRTTLEDLQV